MVALAITLFALAAGLTVGVAYYQALEGDQQALDDLDIIAASDSNVLAQLKAVVGQNEFEEVISRIHEAENHITYHFDKTRELASHARDRINNKDNKNDNGKGKRAYEDWEATVQDWADYVLDGNEGIDFHLKAIELVMLGKSTTGDLMTKFGEMVEAKHTSQSPQFETAAFFRTMIALQRKGVSTLANAYRFKNKASEAQMAEFLEPYATSFRKQMQNSADIVENLRGWWESPINTNVLSVDSTKYHFVDTKPITATAGQVVVGLALYLKGNRVALKVRKAPLWPAGNVRFEQAHWEESPWDEAPTCWIDVQEGMDNNYIDTGLTELPVGYVATGATLYKKGNRVAIKLFGAPMDIVSGSVGLTRDDPFVSPWKESEHFRFLGTRANNADTGYVNQEPAVPVPESYITGAGLYPLKTNASFPDMVSLKLKTAYFKFR